MCYPSHPVTEDWAPLPLAQQLRLWTEGGGSGQKRKCEKFPSSLSPVFSVFSTVGLWLAVAMEPAETPVKDGILYQQHVKFGKVGTPGCQAAVLAPEST